MVGDRNHETRSLAKQFSILFACFWIMIMIREYRACFILHSICLKVGAYFQNVFELNTAEHKLLGFTIPHLEADLAISCKANRHSFHAFFGLSKWLESIVHVLFYTLLGDWRIFQWRLWIKHRETQASLARDTAFGGRFDLIKSDRKFGHIHLLGKGNKLNIPWLLVCFGEGRKTWTINWHVSLKHSKNGGRLKSRWRKDLFQSKSVSFSRMFGWVLWLEIVMYTSFYTVLEDGYKCLRSFWIKQHWTQACSYRGTAFLCEH